MPWERTKLVGPHRRPKLVTFWPVLLLQFENNTWGETLTSWWQSRDRSRVGMTIWFYTWWLSHVSQQLQPTRWSKAKTKCCRKRWLDFHLKCRILGGLGGNLSLCLLGKPSKNPGVSLLGGEVWLPVTYKNSQHQTGPVLRSDEICIFECLYWTIKKNMCRDRSGDSFTPVLFWSAHRVVSTVAGPETMDPTWSHTCLQGFIMWWEGQLTQ